jgi:YggT family protein
MSALDVVRYAVFGLVALACLGALAATAVQRRLLNPFGRPARLIRDATDPFLKPIERRVLRAGGNPQSAPWWLVGGALVVGILAMTIAQWLIAESAVVAGALAGGGPSLTRLAADWAFNLLLLALIVRVVGSWIGIGAYNRWMRPAYVLTEWMLRPLRRILPAAGPLDFSPFVAWFALSIIRDRVLSLL